MKEENPVGPETLSLRLPAKVLEFAEFYGALGNMDRDTLLTKILTERLKEIKDEFKGLPYLNIQETY